MSSPLIKAAVSGEVDVRSCPHLQHELTVVPADEDHFSGESVTSPPTAHQEPGGQAHVCNLLLTLAHAYRGGEKNMT